MQEVFYAKTIKFYCGTDSIPSKWFFDTCKTFRNLSSHIGNSFPSGTPTQTSQNLYSYAQTLTTQGPNTIFQGNLPGPLDILRTYRNKLTVRPQDKILSILSLLPHNIRSTFQPDFHLTPQEVFTKIAVCVMQTTGSLDVICESIRYPFHQNSFSLPS